MTDRELLELAALAAGNGAEWYVGLGMGIDCGVSVPLLWNPLEDDDLALRLAVKLGISIDFRVEDRVSANGLSIELGADHYAATRRAIVRAAARNA